MAPDSHIIRAFCSFSYKQVHPVMFWHRCAPTDNRALIGIRNGMLLSIPMWIAIIGAIRWCL